MKTNLNNYLLIFIGLSGAMLFAFKIANGIIAGSFELRWEKFGLTFQGYEAITIEAGFFILGLLLTHAGVRGCAKHRSA